MREKEFTNHIKDLKDAASQGMIFMITKTGMMMSFWYSALCPVMEGWKQAGLEDEEIDTLLRSPNQKLLWDYRNGAFHFQRRWLSDKQANLFASRTFVAWVNSLHDAFNRRLMAEMTIVNTPPRE